MQHQEKNVVLFIGFFQSYHEFVRKKMQSMRTKHNVFTEI